MAVHLLKTKHAADIKQNIILIYLMLVSMANSMNLGYSGLTSPNFGAEITFDWK